MTRYRSGASDRSEDLASSALQQHRTHAVPELDRSIELTDRISAHDETSRRIADKSPQRETAFDFHAISSDRHRAAAMQVQIHCAFGADAAKRRRVAERCEQRRRQRVAGAAFDGDRTLRGGRQPLRWCQSCADARAETEPIEPGAGEDDRVVVADVELGKTRIDVAAQIAQIEIRTQRTQLCLPAQRRCADACAFWQLIEPRVVIGTSSIAMSAWRARNRAATCSACQSASALLRVAMRSGFKASAPACAAQAGCAG